MDMRFLVTLLWIVGRTIGAHRHKVLDCKQNDVCIGVKDGVMDTINNYDFMNGTMTPKNESVVGCIFNHDCTSMIRFVKNRDAKPSFGTMYIIVDDINLSPPKYPKLFTHLIISKDKMYTRAFIKNSEINFDKIPKNNPVIYVGRSGSVFKHGVYANVESETPERIDFEEKELVNYFNYVKPRDNFLDPTGSTDAYFREFNFGQKVEINEINHGINLSRDKMYIYLYRNWANDSKTPGIVLDAIELSKPILLFQRPSVVPNGSGTSGENENEDKVSSKLWLWVLIGGVVSLLLITSVVYCCCFRKEKKPNVRVLGHRR